jgi:septal ring factor EnvC (AmiA/AmiB activator)
LQIEHEMLNLGQRLDGTLAGKILLGQMSESSTKQALEIENLRAQLDELKTSHSGSKQQLASLLQEQNAELDSNIKERKKAQEELRASLLDIHKKDHDRLLQNVETM